MRVILLATLFLLLPAAAQGPPTVYEPEGNDIPPQMMDYDAERQMFIAHPGWYKDQLIHYYKFRMYVPDNYGTSAATTPSDIPVAPLYLPSTDGTFDGVPAGQNPILQFHHEDGRPYSDFVQVVFVDVPSDYVANRHHSVAELEGEGFAFMPTNILANVPIVPLNSRLEDPDPTREEAPIRPWMAWYDGDIVQTFVFETNSQAFADYINPRTRDEGFAGIGSGYESVVAPSLGSPESGVNFIPIWHVNQFFTGVTPGVNNGGPANMGQRNVVDHDRLDAGYSPLWQVWWVTELPAGYTADAASSASQFGTPDAPADGFAMMATPMFVNCPNIGPHGGSTTNTQKQDGFPAELPADEATTIEGSLVMAGNKRLAAYVGDEKVGEAQTGMMGAYAFTLAAKDVTGDIRIIYMDETAGPYKRDQVVATFEVASQGGFSDAFVWGIVAALAVVLIVLALRRRG